MSRVTESFVIGSKIGRSMVQKTQKTECTSTVALLTVAMVLASTLSTTSFKLQGDRYNFKRGAYQSFIMFVGEWCNLLVFFVILVSLAIFKLFD